MESLSGRRLGKYNLLEEIGRGGMAVVYRGYDTTLERHVAIKVMALHLAWDNDAVERFLREARAAAQLKHPNIITVYDVGQESGWYYFVMELIEGLSLKDILHLRQPLDSPRVISILSQVAAALDHAHQRGLVHRDIKPGNILLEPNGRAVLTDFGIAKAAQQTRLTATGLVVGTPEYIAPEQARGIGGDFRADIYSLGVVAYQMLSGVVPFGAEDTLAILFKHVHEPPLPIQTYRAGLAEGVEAVMQRVLAKDPAQRYPSAGAFADALRRALAGEIVEPVAAEQPAVSVEPAAPLPAVPAAPAPTALPLAAAPAAPAPPPAAVMPLPPPIAPDVEVPTTMLPATAEPEQAAAGPAAVAPVEIPTTMLPAAEERPRKRRRGAGLWIGLGAGLLLVFLAAGFVFLTPGGQALVGIGGPAGVTVTPPVPTSPGGGELAATLSAPTVTGGGALAATVPPSSRTATATATAAGRPTNTTRPTQPSPTARATARPTQPVTPSRVPTGRPTQPQPTVVPTARPTQPIQPTAVPPTAVPPTAVPPTERPPTDVPPTERPPTEVPPTNPPPTNPPPPTDVPPTNPPPPTEVPPTNPPPPTDVPPTEPIEPTITPPPP